MHRFHKLYFRLRKQGRISNEYLRSCSPCMRANLSERNRTLVFEPADRVEMRAHMARTIAVSAYMMFIRGGESYAAVGA